MRLSLVNMWRSQMSLISLRIGWKEEVLLQFYPDLFGIAYCFLT